jgi:hypothetical protein
MTKLSLYLRCALWFVVLGAISQIIHIPTPVWFLLLSACLGSVIAWQSYSNKETLLAALLRLGIIALSGKGICWMLGNIPASTGSFYFTNLSFHATFGVSICILSFISLWLLTYTSIYFYLESALIACAGVILFARHESFRFDRLELISDLSWHFAVSPTAVMTVLGFLSTCVYIAYIVVTPLPARTPTITVRGRKTSVLSFAGAATCLCVIALMTYGTYSYYQGVAMKRLLNGVGMSENNEGVSPLDFNSALGGTNQPAVLVRLEGDYKKNPYSPVLFFRESALSDFNGRELVQAGTGYDSDNPKNLDAFSSEDHTGDAHRTNIIQSVFPLIEHKLFVGIDYPIEIRLLKNPNPGRFKSAYRVYSMAAAYDKELTMSGDVGEVTWTKEQWEHYTKPHSDPRYAEQVKKIVGDETSPVAQARLLQQYLIKNAIYTITPGHTVKAEEDPVAPFLFGDMRGYCVHFAHAMVYMLRSLGIPSRVGTGYLTDLGQAKDGHILLRLNDRHAWAEVFIRDIGWTVFDVQPEKIESHASTEVDSKLLDELMGMIGTPSEFIDSKEAQKEPALQPEKFNSTSVTAFVYKLIGALLGIMCLAKMYLRFGWILPASRQTRIKRRYRALSSWLTDLGFSREYGETRVEYRKRICHTFSSDILMVVDPLLEIAYGGNDAPNNITLKDIYYPPLPFSLKLKGIFSVASLGRWIGGRAW